ncbi:MAG: hypothetical protein AAGB00_10895 [Planctomycetota bacterium]
MSISNRRRCQHRIAGATHPGAAGSLAASDDALVLLAEPPRGVRSTPMPMPPPVPAPPTPSGGAGG